MTEFEPATPETAHRVVGVDASGTFVVPVEQPSIATFLLARIAEDEAVARACPEVDWYYSVEGDGDIAKEAVRGPFVCTRGTKNGIYYTRDLQHIARHDPARVLAECEAKRRIMNEHWECVGSCGTCEFTPQGGANNWPCLTIRALASVYADHPDYREEWALDG